MAGDVLSAAGSNRDHALASDVLARAERRSVPSQSMLDARRAKNGNVRRVSRAILAPHGVDAPPASASRCSSVA